MKVRFLNVSNVKEITESPANKALEASYDQLLAELDQLQEAESNSAVSEGETKSENAA